MRFSTLGVGGKPAVIRVLGFLAGLALVLLVVDGLVRATRVDVIAGKYREVFGGAAPCPTVLWGTSHTSQGVDPRALEGPGRSVFNLAFHASNPSFYQAFYQDAASAYGRPALLLWGVDPACLKRFAWSRRYAQDSEYWPWPVFLAHLGGGEAATVLLNRFPLVKQREVVQDALAGVRPRATFLLEKAYKGYVPVAPTGQAKVPEGNDFADDPAFVAEFPRLLRRLQADHVQVVFFQTPEYLASTGDHVADNAALGAIARSFGIPFLNYNGERRSALNQDPGLYNDGQHLNVLGAERFSRLLATDLRAGGYL